jgi:hypothetical protein
VEGVMSWYQFAVFVFAMIMVNVLTQAVIRGFFGSSNKDSNGKLVKGSDMYVSQQIFTNKIEDMLREICYLRNGLNDRVSEDVCEARMGKLEAVVEEIKKRLDSIEAKIDKVLANNKG